MAEMTLCPGDMFLTTSSGSWLSGAIRAVQTWWAPDGRSQYTHAGIILDGHGKTLEMKIKGATSLSIYDLVDHPVLVARHKRMTASLFNQAMIKLAMPTGAVYPIWRLFLYLFPPLTRLDNGDNQAVCSELVSQFLYHAGLLPYWRGVSPDGLHDIFQHWKGFKIIYEMDTQTKLEGGAMHNG